LPRRCIETHVSVVLGHYCCLPRLRLDAERSRFMLRHFCREYYRVPLRQPALLLPSHAQSQQHGAAAFWR